MDTLPCGYIEFDKSCEPTASPQQRKCPRLHKGWLVVSDKEDAEGNRCPLVTQSDLWTQRSVSKFPLFANISAYVDMSSEGRASGAGYTNTLLQDQAVKNRSSGKVGFDQAVKIVLGSSCTYFWIKL